MKKNKYNDFEVIYFGEDEIIIEEDKRKKYPFMLFFFKYGRLITMLFATISILTFIGGVALTLSKIPKISPINDVTPAIAQMEFDGTDNKVSVANGSVTKEYGEKLFDNKGKSNNKAYNQVTNIIKVGQDKVIYFSNGSAVIIYNDKNKLPVYIENSNNVIIDKKNNSIKIEGNVINTTKKHILPNGMIIYEFANDKLMSEYKDNYKLYDKNKGNMINSINVGSNKIIYFDNLSAVVVYNNKLPDYVTDMNNVKVNNNQITINGERFPATDKQVLPDGSIIYNFNNNKTMYENKNKKDYKLYDKDKIIYDKNGNVKDINNNTNTNSTISQTKEENIGNDKVLYFENGSAVIIYNDKNKLPEYIPNKSDVDTANNQVTINGDKITASNKKILPDNTIIYEFPNGKVLIEKDGKYKLTDKENIEYDDKGNIKDDEKEEITYKEFTIKNNSDEKMKYRIVIEETNNYNGKSKLDPKYIYQKVSINGNKKETKFLNLTPWDIGSKLDSGLSINKNTYILYEGEIASKDIDNINLALWVDYETIPNEMQNKWFIGTIKLYNWLDNH